MKKIVLSFLMLIIAVLMPAITLAWSVETAAAASTESSDTNKQASMKLMAVRNAKLSLYGNGRQVQDFYFFAGKGMDIGEEYEGKDGEHIRQIKGSKEDLQIIKAYVHYLDSMDCPFELNKVHEESFSGSTSMFYSSSEKTFYSATLNYTGNERGIGSRITQTYEDKFSGNIMIYCSIEGSSLKGSIRISSGLEYADLGLRKNGSIEEHSKTGQSSSAEIKDLGGGFFLTDDARMLAVIGEAQVIRDGVSTVTDQISIYRNREKSVEEIRIAGFYRDEWLAFTVPLNSLLSGDELTEREFSVDRQLNEFKNDIEWTFGWRPQYKFTAGHGGKGLFAHTDPINALERVQVNVAIWDPDRDLAVFYISCEFSTAPYELEVLAPMTISGASPYAASEQYTVKTGNTLSITNGSHVDGSSYDIYSWEILEGSKYIELTGTKSRTVQVKGTAKGTARIRGIYEYGVTEQDVLTGNPRYVNKVITTDIEIAVE